MEAGHQIIQTVADVEKKTGESTSRVARLLLILLVNVLAFAILGSFYWITSNARIRAIKTEAISSSWEEAYIRITGNPENPNWSAANLQLHVEEHFDSVSPLQTVYKNIDYKPYFFELSGLPKESLYIFIQRLENLNHDGIDKTSYQISNLKKNLASIKDMRVALLKNSRIRLKPTEHLTLTKHVKFLDQAHAVPASSQLAARLLIDASDTRFKLPSVDQQMETLASDYKDILDKVHQTDVRLISLYRRLASDLGYPHMKQIDENLLLAEQNIQTAMEMLQPETPVYTALREAHIQYSEMAARGEFTLLPYEKKMKTGDSGEGVVALQNRLKQEGFYTREPNGLYDEEAKSAVVRFQKTHGLFADGITGKRTFAQLNLTISEKLQRLESTMRRFHQAPWRKQNYYVRVNIPAFELVVMEEGEITRRHKVVIGNRTPFKLDPEDEEEEPERHNATPVFSDKIDQIVFNPRWYVPERIKDEIDKKNLETDPNYLEKHNYVIVLDEEGNERYYQEGGAGNALGRVKILFPNRYAVYMHDTPSKYLFKKPHRDYSHGCIRLEKPIQFAKYILKNDRNKALEKVKEILKEKDKPKFISLHKRVPVYIAYDTVGTNEEGQIVFYEDLYAYETEEPKVIGKRIN